MCTSHHRLNGHESEQTLGDSEGQGSLVGYSPWGRKELDTTERLTHNTGNYQVLGTVQDTRLTRMSQHGLSLTEFSLMGSPTLLQPYTSYNRGERPTAAMNSLPLGSMDTGRIQRGVLPASLSMRLQNTLTTQRHSPLKSGLRHLSHFNLQMRKLRHQGREITHQGPLSNEVGKLGLVHRYLASLQEEMPLNHSTGNQALREGAEGSSQWSSSRVSLFMPKKTPKSSSRAGHISVLPSPFYQHCSSTILDATMGHRKVTGGTSLVVQWLRMCLAMQGTQVRSLVRELRSHVPQLLKPTHTGGHGLQLLSHVTHRRSHMVQLRPDAAKKTNKKKNKKRNATGKR